MVRKRETYGESVCEIESEKESKITYLMQQKSLKRKRLGHGLINLIEGVVNQAPQVGGDVAAVDDVRVVVGLQVGVVEGG